MKKKMLPMKTWKKQPSKVAHNSQSFFFSTGLAAQQAHFRHLYMLLEQWWLLMGASIIASYILHIISSILLLVVRLGIDNITAKQYIPQKMNLFKIFCVVTWAQLFLTSMVMEAVRGQKPYSERTLWHFNWTFRSSHSASSVYQKK